MDKRFQNIQILIWDFDGTFFTPNQKLWDAVRRGEYRTITNHTGWSTEKAAAEFNKYYKTVFPSATKTVAVLSNITTRDAALEMEQYYDRRKFVQRDDRLVRLFTKLNRYDHYILANGVKKKLLETMETLGISQTLFKDIVTSETVGENKPGTKGFLYILKQTGLLPRQHLMIGDREQVDIVPAKELGMKTCLVWSDTQSAVADVTLRAVYDIERILV